MNKYQQSWYTILFALLVGIGPISLDVYIPSFHQMSVFFNTSLGNIQLTLTIYAAGLALGQLIHGVISDRIGRLPVLYTGIVIFSLGTLLAIFTSSFSLLLIARFLQALGGSAIIVMGRAIINDTHSLLTATKRFANVYTLMMLGPTLGPVIGGYLQSWFSWQATFIFMFFYVIIIFICAFMFLDETHHPQPQQRKKISTDFLSYFTLLFDKKYLTFAINCGLAFSTVFLFISAAALLMSGAFKVSSDKFGWIYCFVFCGFIFGSQSAKFFSEKLSGLQLSLVGSILMLITGILFFITRSVATTYLSIYIIIWFFNLYGAGIVFPISLTNAIKTHPQASGMAVALTGFMQYAIATLMSFLLKIFQQGHIWTIAVMMILLGIIANIVCLLSKQNQ